MDRHEWGEVHLIAGFVFLGLIALHIILHWSVVVNVYHRIVKWKPLNIVIALIFAIISGLIIFLPLFTEPEVVQRGSKGGNHSSMMNNVQEVTDSTQNDALM